MSLGSYLGSYVLSTSPSVPGCPWIQCAYVLSPLYLPSVPPLSPPAAFDSLERLVYEGHDRSGPPRSHDTGDAAAPPHKQCVVQVVLVVGGEEEGKRGARMERSYVGAGIWEA